MYATIFTSFVVVLIWVWFHFGEITQKENREETKPAPSNRLNQSIASSMTQNEKFKGPNENQRVSWSVFVLQVVGGVRGDCFIDERLLVRTISRRVRD